MRKYFIFYQIKGIAPLYQCCLFLLISTKILKSISLLVSNVIESTINFEIFKILISLIYYGCSMKLDAARLDHWPRLTPGGMSSNPGKLNFFFFQKENSGLNSEFQ